MFAGVIAHPTRVKRNQGGIRSDTYLASDGDRKRERERESVCVCVRACMHVCLLSAAKMSFFLRHYCTLKIKGEAGEEILKILDIFGSTIYE